MKTKETKIEQIEAILSNLEGWDLVQINNTFCDVYNYIDNQYYEFDEEFFNTFFYQKPMEAARAVFFGNIQNWGDEFIYFNGYGNLESTSYPKYIESTYVIAECIYENPNDFEGLNDELDLILEDLNN